MPASYLVILLVLAITLAPMLYMIVGGFSTTAQLNANPNALPHPWVWSNYAAIAHLVGLLAGRGQQRGGRRGGDRAGRGRSARWRPSRCPATPSAAAKAFYLLFVVGLLFPLNTAALPLFLLLQQIGLNDNLLGVALPEAAFSLPVTIVIMRPFMRAIPGELEDAAIVDGATRIRFFLRILLPLSRPALITVGILAFVTSWNSYLLPLIVFTSQNHYTLPLAVANFQSTYTQDTARVYAFTSRVDDPRAGHLHLRPAQAGRRPGRRDQGLNPGTAARPTGRLTPDRSEIRIFDPNGAWFLRPRPAAACPRRPSRPRLSGQADLDVPSLSAALEGRRLVLATGLDALVDVRGGHRHRLGQRLPLERQLEPAPGGLPQSGLGQPGSDRRRPRYAFGDL